MSWLHVCADAAEVRASSSTEKTPSVSSSRLLDVKEKKTETVSTSSKKTKSRVELEAEYLEEARNSEYVQSCTEEIFRQLLPVKQGVFLLYPRTIAMFRLGSEELVPCKRDEGKFKKAQAKVLGMVKAKVTESLVIAAEQVMNNVDTFTTFMAAIDTILDNPTKSAGITIDLLDLILLPGSKKKELGSRFMILYDYIEDYGYAKIKFGDAAPGPTGIGSTSYLTECDGLTFLRLLKEKLMAILAE